MQQQQRTLSGVKNEEFAVMPLLHKSNVSDAWASGNSMTDFVRERDFQLAMPNLLHLDVNDPSNQTLLTAKSRAPKIMDRYNMPSIDAINCAYQSRFCYQQCFSAKWVEFLRSVSGRRRVLPQLCEIPNQSSNEINSSS